MAPMLSGMFAETASAAEATSRYKLDASIEARWFPETAADSRQTDVGYSFSTIGQADYHWNEGLTGFTASPFFRYDSVDSERTHGDLREFELRHRSGDFDWRSGIGKVFWGTTEFVHLVDIINQTDAVESVDGEEKLGQPLVGLSWTSAIGMFTGFVLPYFRERTLPGVEGRLRGPVPYKEGDALFQSSDERHHTDTAVRWSYSGDSIDIGISHFAGTAREPRFMIAIEDSALVFQPMYDQIHQTSIDLNAISGGWIWKLEALYQRNPVQDYSAAVGGFEYTLVGSDFDSPEIGFLAEYAWDERDEDATSAFQNDVFFGVRVSLNDVAGSELLVGVGQDLQHSGQFVSVDASRRIGNLGRFSLKVRMMDTTAREDPLYAIKNDDHLIAEYTHYF